MLVFLDGFAFFGSELVPQGADRVAEATRPLAIFMLALGDK